MKNKLLLFCFFCFGLVSAQNTNFKISMSYPNSSKAISAYNQIDSIQKYLDISKQPSNITESNKNEDFVKKIEDILKNSKSDKSIYSAYRKLYLREIGKFVREKDSLINVMNEGEKSESDLDLIKKEIKTIDSKIKEYETKLTDLNDIQLLKSKKPLHFLLGKSKSNAFYNLVYGETSDQVNFLNNSGLLLGNKTGSIYSELASGNLKLIRVSIGTMISNSSAEEDPKEEEAFNRLATSGGNTVLNFEYPFLYSYDSNNQFNLIGRFLGKFTADFPAFGSQTQNFAGSASIGLDLYLDFATSNNEIRFYGNFNEAKYFGTDVFKDNLGIENRDFSFGKITAGLVIKQKLNLSVILSTISSEESLENRHVIIGGSLMF